MTRRIERPPLAAAKRTPWVQVPTEFIEQLQEQNQRQAETIQQLRDEIAILKGEKGKPKFKPSGMDQKAEKTKAADADKGSKLRPGSAKRSKTAALVIHEEQVIAPLEPVPAGSRFKGYRDVVVQELVMAARNTRYRLEVW